jgi:MFS family permease
MSARTERRLAWLTWALSIALVASSVLMWAARDEPLHHLAANSYFNLALIGLTFPLVGALIVAKQPRQIVGWLFCGSGLGNAFSVAASAWSTYAISTHPGLPGGNFAAWLESMMFVPSLAAMIFLLLLFPDGRLPAPRWRWVAKTALTGIAILELFFVLHPHSLDSESGVHVHNPFGIQALNVPLFLASLVAVGLVFVALCGSFAALVSRFRHSRGRERLQLKWFTYAAGVVTVLAVGGNFIPTSVGYGIFEAIVIGPLLAAAVGVAMLRHQLYDIDVVINRTLVYGALTAILAGVYVGTVLLLQLALDPLTSDSSLAVAVSTLAVAALFRPIRARVQAAVDRRFYRRKYDAAQTLEQFSARLREQVDLDALGGELRGVVTETMQPAHVSLWLRGAR